MCVCVCVYIYIYIYNCFFEVYLIYEYLAYVNSTVLQALLKYSIECMLNQDLIVCKAIVDEKESNTLYCKCSEGIKVNALRIN